MNAGAGAEQGGSILLFGGEASDGVGGDIVLSSGTSKSLGGMVSLNGKGVSLGAYQTPGEREGVISIFTSSSSSTVGTEAIKIFTGDSSVGPSATVVVSTGSSSDVAGSVVLRAGSSLNNRGGDLDLRSGEGLIGGQIVMSAGNAFQGHGGDLLLTSGMSGSSSAGGGNVRLASSEGAGTTGGIDINSGTSSAGHSGSVLIKSGDSEILKAGDIVVSAGTGADLTGSDVSILSGDTALVNEQSVGGILALHGGVGSKGGDVLISGGFGST